MRRTFLSFLIAACGTITTGCAPMQRPSWLPFGRGSEAACSDGSCGVPLSHQESGHSDGPVAQVAHEAAAGTGTGPDSLFAPYR